MIPVTPITPKTASSYKRVRSNSPTSSCSFDCQSLQDSLKRVRLSSSPGEYRLLRDIRHAVQSVGWRQVADHQWISQDETIVMTRQNDPLRFQLYIPIADCTLSLQIPRLYPHKPPSIVAITYGTQCQLVFRPQSILIATQPDDPAVALAQACPTVVLVDWSPLTRLVSILHSIQKVFWMAAQGPDDELKTVTIEEVDVEIKMASKNSKDSAEATDHGRLHNARDDRQTEVFFPPNRFDQGYVRSSPGYPMEM